MSIELKVKAKTLAEEARIIRSEEKKQKAKASWNRLKQQFSKARNNSQTLDSLHEHRLLVVRPEARATHLARAYISGHDFATVDNAETVSTDIAKRAYKMVTKYHDKNLDIDTFFAWIK